jgi:hypothetical protein
MQQGQSTAVGPWGLEKPQILRISRGTESVMGKSVVIPTASAALGAGESWLGVGEQADPRSANAAEQVGSGRSFASAVPAAFSDTKLLCQQEVQDWLARLDEWLKSNQHLGQVMSPRAR